MFKKALIAAASVVALSAPSFAGSIGTIQGTVTTTITAGTKASSVTGDYSSEEHTVGASTEGLGATANGSWDPTAGPALTVDGVGGASTNSASATYSTNAVANGAYSVTSGHSYTGTESVTTAGVFFNY